jgi:DnaK suppressor protein
MEKKSKHQVPDFFNEDDDDFSAEELAYFRKRLEDERTSVQERLRLRLNNINDEDRPADELDQAGRMSDQAFILKLADKERKLLQQVELALGKIEKGEFGICEGTDEIISRKRLVLRPWTRYSIEFKEELERAKKQGL